MGGTGGEDVGGGGKAQAAVLRGTGSDRKRWEAEGRHRQWY